MSGKILEVTVHQYNKEQLDKLKKESTKKLKFSKVVMTADQHYNTLCDHPGCYSNCHLKCQLPHSFDTEIFKNCACMAGSCQTGVCAQCKHSYVTHYHHYVRFDHQEINDEYKKIVDQISKEGARALQELSAKIEEFDKKSSAKNYIQLLKTQLEVIKIYI